MYENEIYSEPGVANRASDTDGEAAGEQQKELNSAVYQAYNVFPGENAASPAGSNPVKAKKEKVKKKKESNREGGGIFRKLVLSLSLGLCFGLFAGLGFYAVQLGTGSFTAQEVRQEESGGDSRQDSQDKKDAQEASGNTITVVQPSSASSSANTKIVQIDASDMVDQVMPSMVSIVNNVTVVSNYWGQTYKRTTPYSGSGIIVAQNDEELLIVSNNHVVEGTDNLVVTFIDGTEAEAVIKGLDVDMDLAVISVSLADLSQDTKNAIAIARLGDSDALRLGEPVIAIGNALGYGQSVSGGMVSALARELTFDDGSTGTFIQTDAAINPGNSGGALLNLQGEVIGINSSKIGGTYVEGMGYAIPITAASPIIAELMERDTRTVKVEESKKGYMGIQPQDITEEASVMYNMPMGVFVYSVESGTAAEAAGIRKGDIIVSFDGQKISSIEQLLNTLQYYRAGETVVVGIKRLENSEYETYELEITLGKMP